MAAASTWASELSAIAAAEVVVTLAHASLANAPSITVVQARGVLASRSRIAVFALAHTIEAVAVVTTVWEAAPLSTSNTRPRVVANADAILALSLRRARVRALPLVAVNTLEALVAVALALNTHPVLVAVAWTTKLATILTRELRVALTHPTHVIALALSRAIVGAGQATACATSPLGVADALARAEVALPLAGAVQGAPDL